MLAFPIDPAGWTEAQLRDEFDVQGDQLGLFRNLPTGLLVAGFLANASLLNVDRQVAEHLRLNEEGVAHSLAHFRYVDDHVFLSPDPDAIIDWVKRYTQIIGAENDGWSVNVSKVEPDSLRKYMECPKDDEGRQATLKRTFESESLDPEFPRPLLSHTLTKISVIASTRFELLDDESQLQFIQDLEMLLLGDFGATEVRPDTRASFAASVLARSAPHCRQMTTEAWRAKDERQRCQHRLSRILERKALYIDDRIPNELLVEEQKLSHELPDLVRRDEKWSAEVERVSYRNRIRTFRLLTNAIGRYPDKIRLWLTAVRVPARELGIPVYQNCCRSPPSSPCCDR